MPDCSLALQYHFRHLISSRISTQQDTGQPDLEEFRLLIYGSTLIHTVLIPFIVCYSLVWLSFNYLLKLKVNPQRVGGMDWTSHSKLLLRDTDELPHEFNARRPHLDKLVSEYLSFYSSESTRVVSDTLSFLIGGLAFFILVIAFFNYPVVIYYEVLHRDLLWWLASCIVFVALLNSGNNEPLRSFSSLCRAYWPDTTGGPRDGGQLNSSHLRAIRISQGHSSAAQFLTNS